MTTATALNYMELQNLNVIPLKTLIKGASNKYEQV